MLQYLPNAVPMRASVGCFVVAIRYMCKGVGVAANLRVPPSRGKRNNNSNVRPTTSLDDPGACAPPESGLNDDPCIFLGITACVRFLVW